MVKEPERTIFDGMELVSLRPIEKQQLPLSAEKKPTSQPTTPQADSVDLLQLKRVDEKSHGVDSSLWEKVAVGGGVSTVTYGLYLLNFSEPPLQYLGATIFLIAISAPAIGTGIIAVQSIEG